VNESTTSAGRLIKVGVIADQTGPLSFVGIANANVAKMVINDINAKGGLLGRQIDLYLEDSATTDSAAEAKATKLEGAVGQRSRARSGQPPNCSAGGGFSLWRDD
jgi:ABC-type branched-subunit amino acid transport system substrate-binding protein